MEQYDSYEFSSLVEISRLANSLQTVMDMGMEDITSKQWLLLMVLGKCEKKPNLNQLAEKCGITRQSAKQLVDRLVKKDLVKIEKDDSNKLNILIVITEKGRNWGIINLERNLKFVKKLYSSISQDDIRIFAEVHKKLLHNLADIKEKVKMGELL